MSRYDQEYQTPDLFGQPYPELVEFFQHLPTRGSLLDLGCGQGRDSLALARMGYEVTGVDISSVGVEQMLAIAQKEGLALRGEVANIYTYEFAQEYDIVLFDSMLRFGIKAREVETELLTRAAAHAHILCVCTVHIPMSEKALRGFFAKHEADWETLYDGYLDYEFKDPTTGRGMQATYLMLVMRKNTGPNS